MPIVVPGGGVVSGAISLCSVADMVPEVRAILDDKPYQDALGNSPAAGDVTITLNHATASNTTSAWVQGNVGEFDDGTGEQFLVLADPAGTTVSVSRGYHSTTAVGHTSGTGVLKGFTYSYDQISKAIDDVVRDSWSWAWATLTQNLTPVTTTLMYALNGDFVDLVRVTQKTTGTTADVRDLTHLVSIQREVESATWSSALALRVPWFDNTTNDIIVTYRAKLTTSTVECGLMSDAVVRTAVQRLVRAKAIPAVAATDTQSDDNTQRQGVRTSIGRDWWADALSAQARCKADLTMRHRPYRAYVRTSGRGG